jgi:hypothetical protein
MVLEEDEIHYRFLKDLRGEAGGASTALMHAAAIHGGVPLLRFRRGPMLAIRERDVPSLLKAVRRYRDRAAGLTEDVSRRLRPSRRYVNVAVNLSRSSFVA